MILEQIDTSTTAGKAEVMRLASLGHRFVARLYLSCDEWRETYAPVWDWVNFDYAIVAEQPGPREIWLQIDRNGEARGIAEEGCESPEYTSVRYVRGDL